MEIINPGCLAGGRSIEEGMLGNSFARNPLMANFCAKLMPYRGLGSGIPRVLAENCNVVFNDDKCGNQFTATVSRVSSTAQALSEKDVFNNSRSKEDDSGSKTEVLLEFCSQPKSLTEIAKHLGMKEQFYMKRRYIDPLLGTLLSMTEPDSPNSPTQKYVTIKRG